LHLPLPSRGSADGLLSSGVFPPIPTAQTQIFVPNRSNLSDNAGNLISLEIFGKGQSSMLTRTENIVILILMMVGSMLFMKMLNRIWPREKRREHNDLIGWQLGILGTTYAVILGFMLYTVWTTYGAAELNADLEANALRNVNHLAEGLPDEQRAALERQTRAYADAVVDHDWPEMAHNRIPEQSHLINQDMWKTLMSIKLATPSEITAEDHALYELSALTEHRRTRLLQSAYRLPTIFWCVLLVGGAVTILSASMFGSINVRLHALQVFCFTLLITLVLLAIADVNLPFRGWVHVSNFSFIRAQQNMNE
jgi:hypothetical protein